MNWTDWYTDTADVYRVTQVRDGALTRHKREKVLSGVPCRVYEDGGRALNLSREAAFVRQESLLACGNEADIRPGDELFVFRGGALGKTAFVTRAIAGEPHRYFEPFGAVIPGLAHQEIRLLQQERVDGLEGKPGEAEGPEGLDTPEEPDAPGKTDAPEEPDTSEEAGASEETTTPEEAGAPEEPDALEGPGTPEKPDALEEPGAPEKTNAPAEAEPPKGGGTP